MDIENLDTIAAIATPPGNGGVGIIRISGALVPEIAKHLIRRACSQQAGGIHSIPEDNKELTPRRALYSSFTDDNGSVIDSGITLYFPAPASYTGEDILELQGHGGSVVLDMLLRRVLSLGARLANPGEFTERAFLNDKLDLAQAEAVADLIESSTEQSVRSAQKSMQGVFSVQINELVEELTELRIYVEAAIDFVDEEIDFLTDGVVENRIVKILHRIGEIQKTAQQGRLLRDGMTVVLAGKPNAGKSSLLNALAGHEAAIVTDIAGTTRDVLKERIQLDGMPLHIIDTAGLRESDNPIEQEGIRRAHQEIKNADKILLLIDARDPEVESILTTLPSGNITQIYNKIDLLGLEPEIKQTESGTQIYLSIKTGSGMELLKQHLKQSVGFNEATDNVFIARRRHIEALSKGHEFVESALDQLRGSQAGELVAEDLRQAQNSLAEITGKFTSDDLLGKIFSSFCIGK
ncbi:tRNA uridine-5-carboxymethylaminomethyl(34) synthesis GTPase MnmE [Methylobacter sp.]|uniref:tRNA uridine-5-carboxymethylaminomethyl(34) synthesis GTPase MnmE n=1 Tax=Methylobacter sp. TaxID=2051955 RepID=UPI0024894DA6|nr:tRNA uridine-5-carboxymethylaminomethyl(34) synthesis GTPase MnmE [Methylobacter sp.]MDI1278748.1 tRNA uridine-5-carboxymethylaminomethyl(34) synthesis GTPase MnmE [Methylobacter sp.]MDI1359546.1 tRNA uridine-5-carboxymethylaminomethyl(34) synthesis GTPase MnmE [Methylobacter sp.]